VPILARRTSGNSPVSLSLTLSSPKSLQQQYQRNAMSPHTSPLHVRAHSASRPASTSPDDNATHRRRLYSNTNASLITSSITSSSTEPTPTSTTRAAVPVGTESTPPATTAAVSSSLSSRSKVASGMIARRAARPLNILVAEDNTVNQKVIRQMLKMQGYSTDIVDNGKKAVDTVLARSIACQGDPTVGCYDLVLMDVQVCFIHPHCALIHIQLHCMCNE
jgi:CheY-like chemotaxis protein